MSTLLIETCMEGGALTDAQIAQALAGQAHAPAIKAMLSLIELAIGNERLANETAMVDRVIHEHRGGSKALQALRLRVLDFVAERKPIDEKPAT